MSVVFLIVVIVVIMASCSVLTILIDHEAIRSIRQVKQENGIILNPIKNYFLFHCKEYRYGKEKHKVLEIGILDLVIAMPGVYILSFFLNSDLKTDDYTSKSRLMKMMDKYCDHEDN